MRDWFKARNAWGAVFESMPDAEAGKLVKALWSYTMTGKIPECDGYIGGLLTMMRLTLDLDKEKEEDISRKRAVAAAGRREANAAIAAIDNNCNQMPANAAIAANGDNKNKNKEKEEEKEKDQESYFISDEEAFAIQREHDQILEAAKNAGFKGSPSENADLLRIYAEYGKDKMLEGINACVEHSAPNLAYLRAVLKGSGQKGQKRVLPAQDFQQRDYSGVQKEIEKRQSDNIVEMLCRNNGLWDEANNCPVDGWREKLDKIKEGA